MPEYKNDTDRVSRVEQFEKDGIDVTMPECVAAHLVSYLYEIGPTLSGGMGESPISHSEIESWQRNTGVVLDSWQAKTIRRLSSVYLSESHKATKVDAPAPWREAPYLRYAVAKRMQRMFDDMEKL